jgi:WD40 repeat protein
MAINPDGSLLYVSGASNNQHATVAYDADTGTPVWTATYVGNGLGYPVRPAISPDGARLFVAGSAYPLGQSHYEFVTAAYDARTGTRLWERRWDTGRDDQVAAVGVSPDGSKVLVTGFAQGPAPTYQDYVTIAYDALTGSRLWQSRFDRGRNDYAAAQAVSPNGSSIFVSGWSTDPVGSGADIVTVAMDAETGAKQWVARYDGGDQFSEVPRGLAVTPDGATLLMAGDSNGYYATVAYSATTGAQQWAARYGTGSGYVGALALSPDGATTYVTGEVSRVTDDWATVAYDTTDGGERWTAILDGPQHFHDFATAICVSPGGSFVYVAGRIETPGYDFLVAVYDATTGQRLGVSPYDSGGDDDPVVQALVSPDGSRLFVTGSSKLNGSVDFLTLAYEATGLVRPAMWPTR